MGALNVKKVVGILAVALLAYFIIAQPANASDTASSLTNTIQTAADNVLQFFTNLAN